MLLIKGKFLKANGLTKLAYDFEVPIELPTEQITYLSAGVICLAVIPELDFVSVIKLDSGNLRRGHKSNENPIGKIMWALTGENSDCIIDELVKYQQKKKEGVDEK